MNNPTNKPKYYLKALADFDGKAGYVADEDGNAITGIMAISIAEELVKEWNEEEPEELKKHLALLKQYRHKTKEVNKK